MIQGASDAVVINISPTMFFLTVLAGITAIVLSAVKFTNWMTAWMTRIEQAVAEIPSLRSDRHDAKEHLLLLEQRMDAADKWIESQEQEERTLKTAVAEFINDRRHGERRSAEAG